LKPGFDPHGRIPMSDLFLSASSNEGLAPIELKDVSTKSRSIDLNSSITGGVSVSIDANFWLPLAAEHYQISPHLRDYILIPVPSVITDLPNTNGDCLTKNEALRFHPEYGMPAFKTFKGKPTFLEHDNQDITKAKGVILDSYLAPVHGYGENRHAKILKLLAFDRTKDSNLCNLLLSRTINTFSMGMYYKSYTCSICQNTVSRDRGRVCSHTQLKRPTYRQDDGRLVYRKCNDIVGFECSAVADPAFSICLSDIRLMPERPLAFGIF
jgi:hypothetical protein